MKRVRARENHPTFQKIDQVFALMEKLGLSLEVDRMGRAFLLDGAESWQLLDIESDRGEYAETFNLFPPTLEWKLSRNVAEDPPETSQKTKP